MDDPRHVQVSFLGAEPARAAVAELERADVAPERVAVLGREVYAWHPNGVAGSDLAQLTTRPAPGRAGDGPQLARTVKNC